MQGNAPKESDPPRRPFQFGLPALFLLTALVSVLAAALAGMLHSSFDSRMPPGFFVLMAAAAPMAVVILLSLLRSAVRRFTRRR